MSRRTNAAPIRVRSWTELNMFKERKSPRGNSALLIRGRAQCHATRNEQCACNERCRPYATTHYTGRFRTSLELHKIVIMDFLDSGTSR